MSSRPRLITLLLLCLSGWLALPSLVFADIPDFLQPYAKWLQLQNPEWECTQVAQGRNLKRQCQWLGQLDVNASSTGAQLSGWVDLEIPQTVVLPGSDKYWPVLVEVVGLDKLPLRRLATGVPALDLPAGRYQIKAKYEWSRLPKKIKIPKEWAFVDFSLPEGVAWQRSGQTVVFRQAQLKKAQNSQSIQVYRHLQEGLPQILTTELVLRVTGAPRLLTLPRFQVPGSRQMSINSALPMTTLANGDLQIQVRPGRHSIQHVARIAQQKSFEYAAPRSQSKSLKWPSIEYWSFAAADSGLRVSAGQLVDASQVDVPGAWAHLPTYGLSSEQGLTLEQKQSQKPLNRTALKLQKDMWLDFSGAEFVVVDQLQGVMRDQWRLDLPEPGVLERASSNGQPLLITRASDGTDGIELRNPQVNVQTVSRWPRHINFDVIGWNTMVDQVDARLHLPPGWSLMAVMGDRGTSADWVNKWSLWSLFLALLFMTFAFKVYGVLGLGMSSLVVVLVYQTNAQLVLSFVLATGLALAFTQLSTQLSATRAYVGRAVLVIGFLLLLQLVPHTIETARLVAYPQLERSQVGLSAPQSKQAPVNSLAAEADVMSSAPTSSRAYSKAASLMSMEISQDMNKGAYDKNRDQAQLGEKEFLQTGQAAPQWRWNQFYLGSRKIAQPGETLKIYVLEPWQTALWRLGGALVLWLLFIRIVFDAPKYFAAFSSHRASRAAASKVASSAALAVVCLFGFTAMMPGQLMAAPATPVEKAPSDAMLQDLARYLSQDLQCGVECISLSKGRLTVSGDQLIWQMTVDATSATAFPIPRSQHWRLQQVSIDGKASPAQLITSDRNVLMKVPQGSSVVRLVGEMTGAEVRFDIPMPIHHMSYDLTGWFSVNAKLPSLVQDELRLERRETPVNAVRGTENREKKPSVDGFTATYLEVSRQLTLGVRWTLVTRIERKSPKTGLIQAQVPLWPGERPTTALDIKDGNVQVELKGRTLEWVSELDPVDSLSLVSAAGGDYYETWTVNAGPRWRFKSEGLEPLALEQPDGMQQQWRPVAGEQLTLKLSRPEAKQASSQSVEKATLQYTMGETVNQARLELQLLAASPGDYTLELGPQAKVETIQLNGRSLWSEGVKISVPLVAGSHALTVEWKEPATDDLKQLSPQLRSSLPLYNLHMKMSPKSKTWILAVFGPSLGPAVLFWGVLAVIIGGAFGLYWLQRQCATKKKMTMPMSGIDWFLLGVGLSSVWHYALIPIAAWLFVMSWRHSIEPKAQFSHARQFKGLQVVLIAAGVMIALLVASLIPKSLLANPQMFIQGNGSSVYSLRWFQDATAGEMPSFGFFALPTWVFHGLMLLWSLWLAQKMVQWFKFALSALQVGSAWHLNDKKEALEKGLDVGDKTER